MKFCSVQLKSWVGLNYFLGKFQYEIFSVQNLLYSSLRAKGNGFLTPQEFLSFQKFCLSYVKKQGRNTKPTTESKKKKKKATPQVILYIFWVTRMFACTSFHCLLVWFSFLCECFFGVTKKILEKIIWMFCPLDPLKNKGILGDQLSK